MTIVVDINCLPLVFSEEAQDHENFRPVKRFLDSGRGVLIYGGSKYLGELAQMTRYMRTIRLMSDQGRAVKIDKDAVDAKQAEVAKAVEGTDCDDPHIIALLAVSNCGLLCSVDRRSFPYVQDPSFYPRNHPGVSIYSGRRVRHLLRRQRQRITNRE